MLELMKQRIEEANRPKAQSPELTASESEREAKTRQLSEKQTELERQQAQANSVQVWSDFCKLQKKLYFFSNSLKF